eukprot:COSAG01_NODE_35379_length_532_cov_12.136259_1_plen_129_part_00
MRKFLRLAQDKAQELRRLQQEGWWVPLPSLGTAPELGGYDGGGDGAHTRNRGGAGAVADAGVLVGAAPLSRGGAGAGRLRRQRRRRAHPQRGGAEGRAPLPTAKQRPTGRQQLMSRHNHPAVTCPAPR